MSVPPLSPRPEKRPVLPALVYQHWYTKTKTENIEFSPFFSTPTSVFLMSASKSNPLFGPAAGLGNLRPDNAHAALTLTFIASAVLAYAVVQAVYRLWFHPLARVPGPRKYSLSYLFYLYENHYLGTFFRDTPRLLRDHGPVVRVGPNHVLVDGQVALAQVFGRRKADETEFEKLQPTDRFEGHSLLVAPHDVHRRQRKQLAHAFSEAAL
ncbi:hypothetical protein E4U41_005883, partial [Claviceps citrina]